MNDFKVIYTAGRAFAQNRNPYLDDEIKNTWREVSRRQNLVDEAAPGLPETPFVYPPAVLLVAQPFSWFAYPVAKVLWFGLNLFFLAGIFFLLARMGGFSKIPYDLLVCALVLLGLKSTRLGLVSGQMVFFSFFFCLLSYRFANCGRPLLAATGLTLAMLKYSFALPFLLFFVTAQKYKIALLAVCLTIVFSAIALTALPAGTLQAYLASVKSTLASGGINDFSFANARYFELTGLHGVLYFLFRSRTAVWIVSIILMFGAGYIAWRYRKYFLSKTENMLMLFTFCSLLFTYHRIYDSIGLFAIFLLCRPSVLFASLRWKAVLLLPLFLPITGLVLRLKPFLPQEAYHVLVMDVPL
ncbi:MAG: glycosyltransferase family 87 protein, partial [bacterium]